jgi:hypothetical protein
MFRPGGMGTPGISKKFGKDILRFGGIGREPCRSVPAALKTCVFVVLPVGMT